MKQSLEQLLSQLPTYMRDKNDEVYILTSRPALEVCGPFPDGKAKRRERRKLERLKKKRL